VTLLAGVCLRCLPASAGNALVPWSGPENSLPIDLLRTDGSPFALRDLRGKVVLVNFWASWCEPCIAEMPSLQRLRERLGAERFEVLAVNFREGPARIDAFVKKAGIAFPVVRDTDGAVARAWGARVFPSSYLVDREGRIRYVLTGEVDWTSPELVSTITALLGPPPAR
jgi:thiol-disulfide isomerase/thioredoxin